MPPITERFSFAPIEHHLLHVGRTHDILSSPDVVYCSNWEYLGLTRPTYDRARANGWLSLPMAEKVATELGQHISNIWPEYFGPLRPEPALEVFCARCGCRPEAHRVENYGKVRCSCGHCNGWRDG
jgi:hypothetical protein